MYIIPTMKGHLMIIHEMKAIYNIEKNEGLFFYTFLKFTRRHST